MSLNEKTIKNKKAPKVSVLSPDKNYMKESGTGSNIKEQPKIYKRKNLSK
jgi:hypothetical protein